MSMANDEQTGETDDAATRQKREIAGFYSRVASRYDAVGPAVFARLGELVVALAGIPAGIREGAQVLDVAAGRGANLFPAARAVGPTGRVIGIDIAPAMVEETTRALAERGLANAAMLRMDAEELTFADESFDVVLCSFAYFFFPHLERALAQFYRVLRPGGTLLLTAHGGTDERWQWYEDLLIAFYARHNLAWPLPVGGGHRPLGELRTMLIQVGFASVRVVPEAVEAVYADAEEWWAAKWTHGARRPLEAMPPNLLQAFVAEVNDHLAPLRLADGFHERWRVHCALGTKRES